MEAGPGRPSKLTPEVMAGIIQAVEDGCPYHVAAGAHGISESTFYSWQEQGADDPEGDYGCFLEALTQAKHRGQMLDARALSDGSRGYTETTTVDNYGPDRSVTTHVKRDWRAAEARLKRRHPEDWSEKRITEHQGEVAFKKIVIEAPDEIDHVQPAQPEESEE